MSTVKKLSLVMVMIIAFSAALPAGLISDFSYPMQVAAASAKNPKLSAKKYVMAKKQTFVLKVLKGKKSVKWSASNKKVQLKKSGKYGVKVTAKSTGKVKVFAKTAGKKLTCKVTIKNKLPVKRFEVIEAFSGAEVKKGQSKKLSVMTVPENTTDKITYSSTDTSVVKVKNGKITGVSYGAAYVNVKCGKFTRKVGVLCAKPEKTAAKPDITLTTPAEPVLNADRYNVTLTNNGTSTLRLYAPAIVIDMNALLGGMSDNQEDYMFNISKIVNVGGEETYQSFSYIDIAPNTSVELSVTSKTGAPASYNSLTTAFALMYRYDTRYYEATNIMGITENVNIPPFGGENDFNSDLLKK